MACAALKLFAALSLILFYFSFSERLQSLASFHHQAHQQAECYNLQSSSSEGEFFFHCEIALGELFFILIRQFDSPHMMNIHSALIL